MWFEQCAHTKALQDSVFRAERRRNLSLMVHGSLENQLQARHSLEVNKTGLVIANGLVHRGASIHHTLSLARRGERRRNSLE